MRSMSCVADLGMFCFSCSADAWLHYPLQPTACRAPRCHGVGSIAVASQTTSARVEHSSPWRSAVIFLAVVVLPLWVGRSAALTTRANHDGNTCFKPAMASSCIACSAPHPPSPLACSTAVCDQLLQHLVIVWSVNRRLHSSPLRRGARDDRSFP